MSLASVCPWAGPMRQSIHYPYRQINVAYCRMWQIVAGQYRRGDSEDRQQLCEGKIYRLLHILPRLRRQPDSNRHDPDQQAVRRQDASPALDARDLQVAGTRVDGVLLGENASLRAWKVNANLTLIFLASSDETASLNRDAWAECRVAGSIWPTIRAELMSMGLTHGYSLKDATSYLSFAMAPLKSAVSILIRMICAAATGLYGNIVHISTHQLVIMAIFHQEGIMAMAGGDFRITDIQFVIQQCPDNGAGALRRKTPVSGK